MICTRNCCHQDSTGVRVLNNFVILKSSKLSEKSKKIAYGFVLKIGSEIAPNFYYIFIIFTEGSLKNDECCTKFIEYKYILMKYTSDENKGHIRSRRKSHESHMTVILCLLL